jgi:hypothetical protein
MNKENTFEEEAANFNVGHVLSDSFEHRAQTGSEVCQTLFLRVQTKLVSIRQKHFHSVTNLTALKVALDKSVVDLRISSTV